MNKLRRTLAAVAVLASVLTAGLVVPPAAPAQADPGIDPANGNWAKWTFHMTDRYDLVLDVDAFSGNGGAVQLWPNNGKANQVWFQEAAAEGGQFLHPGYNRWLCLGRTGNGWGTPVTVQDCNGSVNQRWGIPRYAYEYYRIKPWDDSNICVDVPSSNYGTGVDLQLWGCNETHAQLLRVGTCYLTDCNGQWPANTNCVTGGAKTVRDVTEGGDRLQLVYSAGCFAFFAVLSWESGHVTNAEVRVVQEVNGQASYYSGYVDAGATGRSPMWGVGGFVHACAVSGFDYHEFCTLPWWITM